MLTKTQVRNDGNAGSPNGYQRFKIETHQAPPRRKQPRPFNPRVSKVGLARMLIGEIAEYNLKLSQKGYRKILLSRPCIYGTFSGRFGGFHPIKEKCTGCMRCVQEFPGVCTVDRNPEFYKFADSYWIPADWETASGSPVATVSTEAESGKIPIKGMGYKGAFAGEGWDSIWTDMSEIVRPTRDGVYGREYISTNVDIGRKQNFLDFSNDGPDKSYSKTVEVPLPIIFDYLPPNLNSKHITESIALAAAHTGTMFIATPHQAQQLSERLLEKWMPLVSSNDIAEDDSSIRDARILELEQYDTSLLERITDINKKCVCSVRIPLRDDSGKAAAELVRAGVDVIHLTADYHGRGLDPEKPRLIKDLLRSVHQELLRESNRDEVTLIASGGIILAEHVPKAIICGADLVAIDTTTLVSLQAQFLGECKSPETGKIQEEAFDSAWGQQRLVNLLGSWHDQLIEILSAMGMRDVRRLRGDVGRAMFNEDLEKEAFAGIERRK